MNNATRFYLASEFSGVMSTIREDKWDIFCEAAEASGVPPYEMLARLLVRIVEEATDDGSVADSDEVAPAKPIKKKAIRKKATRKKSAKPE